MKSKTTKNPVAIKVISNLIERVPDYKSGTYNQQDPTTFEKGSGLFNVFGNQFQVMTNDCTWGVEVEIYIVRSFSMDWEAEAESFAKWQSFNKGKKYLSDYHISGSNITYKILISNFYLSRGFNYPDELIIRKKQKGIYRIIATINKNYEPIHKEEEDHEM